MSMEARVPASEYRANLRAWHDRVLNGEEIIVTEHGTPTVRVVRADGPTVLQRLEREGLVRPARPRRPARELGRVKPAPGDVATSISKARDR